MNITWHGLSCIEVDTKVGLQEVTLIADPYEPQGRFKVPRRSASVVASTQPKSPLHNEVKVFAGDPFIIDIPGEYEVKGVMIRTVRLAPLVHALSISFEGVTVGLMTRLSDSLSDAMLEKLGTIDVLMLAVGDADALPLERALSCINQIEPRIIVPVHYQLPGWPTKLATKDAFLKTLGLPKPEPIGKLKITKRDIPADETRLVILEG